MAAPAGKKELISVSLFMEVNILEVEEELSTMATLAWRKVSGKMGKRATEGLEEGNLGSTDTERGQRTCRSRHVRNSRSWNQVAAVPHLGI